MSDPSAVIVAPNSTKKSGWRTLWQILVPVGCLLVFARVVNLQQLANILLSANPLLMSVAWLVYGLTPLIFLCRWWRVLLRLAVHYRLRRLLPIYSTGYAFQYFLPTGLGDFVKLFYIVEDGYSTEKATMSVMVDKLASYTSALALGCLGLFILPMGQLVQWASSNIQLSTRLGVCMAVAAGLFVLAVLIYWQQERLATWFQPGSVRWQAFARLLRLGQNSVQELAFFSSYDYTEYIVLSLLAGTVEAFVYYLIALAVNIDLSFVQVWAISSLLTLLLSIPVISVTIGGLGIRDSLITGIFLLLGRSIEQALAFSLLIFVVTASWRVIALAGWLARPINPRGLVEKLQR
jgi:glycosyltransferase 2 family protein